MKKILSHILTPVFYLAFALLLLVFHPVQIVCRKFWGYHSHKKSVDLLNFLILNSLRIVGSKIRIEGNLDLPVDRPIIFVANHQSTYDIPAVIWILRKYHPKFIAKIELSRHLPSISYNLRHGGSALIDRKNPSQSIKEIIKLGRFIGQKNYSVCIFPEGTRSRSGKPAPFHAAGIKTLLKVVPSALIVPFVIHHNYNLHKYGAYPLGFGETLKFSVMAPIETNNRDADELVGEIEEIIKAGLIH